MAGAGLKVSDFNERRRRRKGSLREMALSKRGGFCHERHVHRAARQEGRLVPASERPAHPLRRGAALARELPEVHLAVKYQKLGGYGGQGGRSSPVGQQEFVRKASSQSLNHLPVPYTLCSSCCLAFRFVELLIQ